MYIGIAINWIINTIYDVIFPQTRDDLIKEFNKGKRTSLILENNKARKLLADSLFKNNKVSDEYYTTPISWERYLTEKGWLGQTFCDPFIGDGGLATRMKNLCKIVDFGKGNYFDLMRKKVLPEWRILSNPPFSCKMLVIQSLLEIKKSFSLILPFQVPFNSKGEILKSYQKIYGGRFNVYKMKSKEQVYSTIYGKNKSIGTIILEWDF
jgi:hypothetical protein